MVLYENFAVRVVERVDSVPVRAAVGVHEVLRENVHRPQGAAQPHECLGTGIDTVLLFLLDFHLNNALCVTE